MSQNNSLKISLGPAPHNWGRKKLMEFYTEEVPALGVDAVYVGNIICHNREVLSQDDFKTITDTLRAKGVKNYYSTLTLVTKPEEMETARQNWQYFDGVEVNMIGYLNQLKRDTTGKEIILGPYLNIYNWKSAAFLKKYNPVRLGAPFEIPLESISDIMEKAGVPVEVTAWGHISTALSWRCYSARAVDRSREKCGKICFEYPEGMLLKSVEEEDLFRIDGLQVMSAKTHSIIEHLSPLREKGVESICIYPDYQHTGAIVDIFQKVIRGELEGKEGNDRLLAYAPHGTCNGWLMGKAGWEYVAA